MTAVSDRLRWAYHRLVPASVRWPLGRARRDLRDLGRRMVARRPLPPARLLDRVQRTPWLDEYLTVGNASAQAVARELGDSVPTDARVLDFGCGLGRTLRPLLDLAVARHWRIEGCDIDPTMIAWNRGAFPQIRFEVNGEHPPLPYPSGRFDAVIAISLFTHFDAAGQRRWARELGRVLQPGGLALLSLMGPRAFASFPDLQAGGARDRLEHDGFFLDDRGTRFNERGAYHTAKGLALLMEPHLELLHHQDGGLDRFQDVAVLRRPPSSPSAPSSAPGPSSASATARTSATASVGR
ncbi:MAG: class I SAM-dependent methyltransferase [Acidobacteriota bacterium]